MKQYRIGILGATGAVGREMIKVLEERKFPISELRLLAGAGSAGKRISFMGKEHTVIQASEDAFEGLDIVLGAAENDIAMRFAPAIVKAGAVFVDNSSAFRLYEDVPLVVSEINPEDVRKHRGIIANPNCTTIISLVALNALNKESPIESIIASSYQAVSGAGAQGRTQLEAAMLVRPNLKKLWVYDIVPANAERFVNEAKEKYPQLDILIADDLEQAIRESDIIITVTLAEEPFVKAAWIKRGALIVQMATLEVEYGVATNADKIVVDFWDTIKHRMASTIAVMASEGLVKDEDISASLGEILSGKKTGRDNDDQVIYFNSVGAGILDLAVTTRCYREALKRNVGTWVPYWV